MTPQDIEEIKTRLQVIQIHVAGMTRIQKTMIEAFAEFPQARAAVDHMLNELKAVGDLVGALSPSLLCNEPEPPQSRDPSNPRLPHRA